MTTASIPNVSAGAISGLDNAPLVRLAPATNYDAGMDLPTIPDDKTTVPDLLAWVRDDDPDEEAGRAIAVLSAERDKAPHDRRSSLVEPLERKVLDWLLDAASGPEETVTSGGGAAPDAGAAVVSGGGA